MILFLESQGSKDVGIASILGSGTADMTRYTPRRVGGRSSPPVPPILFSGPLAALLPAGLFLGATRCGGIAAGSNF